MKRSLSFTAQPTAAGKEDIRLLEISGSRIPFSKATTKAISFDQWTGEAPAASRAALARILQALEDGELASDREPLVALASDSVALHPDFVARLSDPEATSLGLPPSARLSLNLQSLGVPQSDEFRVVTRWTRPNGLPAQVQLTGCRIRQEGKDWRVPEPIWSVLRAVYRLNEASDQSARDAALASLREAVGDDDRQHIQPDGFIERLRLTYAAGFSLDLLPGASGFDFDPVLFSPERLREAEDGQVLDEAADGLLPPKQQAAFVSRFRRGDGGRRAYLLDDGAILFIDPDLQTALRVVREAQRSDPETRREFARSPQRFISEAVARQGASAGAVSRLFVETQQFSDRVSGIDVWRKPVLPWIKPKPNSWLPEAFGLRIGDPPDDQMVEVPLERVAEVLQGVNSAIAAEQPSYNFAGHELPATEQTRSAVSSLAALAEDVARYEAAPAGANATSLNRYFLQVRDNLEDVAYAPLQATKQATLEDASLPTALRSTPKPHQIAGFQWLASCWRSGLPGALLADDMGLGKTFQALAFLAWLRTQQQAPKPVLIVAPTGLLANWRAEITRHLAADALGPVVGAYGTDLRQMRGSASGRDIESGNAGIDPAVWEQAGVVLTTFETMRDYHLSFARQPFSVIIYDEVQKLKNPASQMTRAAKTLNAEFQLAMTGTPVENRLQDLWSIFDVVHPGLLGSSRAFEGAYPASDLERVRALHDLLTKPQEGRPALLLRRMKDDCLAGLPAKHIRVLPTDMPPPQAAAYQNVIGRALSARASGKRGYMLEVLHQLRGVSLHPHAPETASGDYLQASARLHATFATLDAIASAGEKVLIFCESLAMQAMLGPEIRRRYNLDHEVARIHGGVQGEARQAAVDAFQSRPSGFDAIILSPKAGGVGLTLTAANHVIHLSRWWNPAVEDQATDRAYRIGQTRDVYVYLPQAVHPDPSIRPSSFDLKLDALMARKRELSRGLLLPGESDSDIDALLDSVLEPDEAEETVDPPEATASAETPPRAATANEQVRPTLTSNAPPQPSANRSWPGRVSYLPRVPRDYEIFEAPLQGERIIDVAVRDPYGCAGERNRQAIVDLVTILARSASSIGDVLVVSFDAESVDREYRESSVYQRDDLERRWEDAFPQGPKMRHVQLSRRQSRSFHDRSLRATTASGRKIIWDLSNGVDGVMLPHKECTVHLTVE